MSPQIPVVVGQSIKPQGLQPNYQSSATPEGAFGEGYAHAGQRTAVTLTSLSNQMRQQQEEADTTRVNAELADYNKQASLITDAAYQRQGKDAIGVTDSVVAQLEALGKERAKNLANDDQRNKFVPSVMNSITGDRTALSRHEGKERDNFADASDIALAASAAERAGKNWTQTGKGETVEVSFGQVETAIRSRAKRGGWSEEALNLALADGRSSVYAAMMREQTSRNANAAFIKTFEAHEGDLNEKDRLFFRKVYEETSDLAAVVSTTDSTWKAANGNLGVALESAATITDPKRRLDVEQRLRVIAADERAADLENERADIDLVKGYYLDNGSLDGMDRAVYGRVHAKNPEVLQAIKDHREQKARVRAGESNGIVQDQAAIGAWLRLLPAEQADPANDPFVVLRGKASEATIHRFQEKVSDILNQQRGVTDRGAAIKQPAVKNEAVNRRIDQAVKARSMTDAKAGALDDYVWGRVHAYQDENDGASPDAKTMDKIMDEAWIEGERATPEGIFRINRDIQQYEAGRTGDFVPDADQPVTAPVSSGVPPADSARIATLLNSAGRASDPASIRAYYDIEQRRKAKQ